MNGLTPELLGRACRIFLDLAYPEGPATIPPNRLRYSTIGPDQPLDAVLAARDVCQPLSTAEGNLRGYTLRLGSARFPHIKLQVTFSGPGEGCVFAVDTHDVLRIPLPADEAEAWRQLQDDNRHLKECIEREWEKNGLVTFNALLRRGLVQ